jgi:hypothetical protein
MRYGPLTYLWLVIKTAWRHSFHAAHSVILTLIIVAGIVTSLVPQVEVLVDLHGWQVATIVLGGIIVVRLVLAPYWIWKDDQEQLSVLTDQTAANTKDAQRLAAKTEALDDIAEEISWAVNNLVNPKPHPASTADPETARVAFDTKLTAWCDRVSKKLANRDVFTHGDQTHFDGLGFVPTVKMWGDVKLDHLFSELKLKLERLREIEHRARERK